MLSPANRRRIAEFAVVALAYAIASQASLAFRLTGTNVSLVWLPAGIALAAMLLRGAWLWSVVPVTQTLVTLNQGAFNAIRVAAATTVGVVVAYHVLKRGHFEPSLARRRDAVGLIGAAAVGGLAGALLNAGLRVVERGVTEDSLARMLNWWLGDVTGTLLVVPLACTWLAAGASAGGPPARPLRRWEAEALAGLLAVVAGLMPFAFSAGATTLLGLLYAAVPLQMWAAVRYGPRGGTQAFAVVAGAVLLASLVPLEPTHVSDPVSLALLDGFLIVSAAASLVVASAVAEHTRTVDALAESRRLGTVRRLAGGVAHDFNNLLTVIMGHVNLIRAGRADGTDLDAIQRAAVRAAALTQQLLSYGQQTLLRPSVFDVNDVVRELENDLKPVLPAGVNFRTSLGTGLPPVRNDPDQLKRVLEQLCLRAAKGMVAGGAGGAGGAVTIATSHPDSATGGHLPPGSAVVIRVADTGPPLEPEARGRFFEPYPEPLPTGDWARRPSGLELAMAEGFVHQVGGQIAVTSDAGRGTAVTIVLPVAT